MQWMHHLIYMDENPVILLEPFLRCWWQRIPRQRESSDDLNWRRSSWYLSMVVRLSNLTSFSWWMMDSSWIHVCLSSCAVWTQLRWKLIITQIFVPLNKDNRLFVSQQKDKILPTHCIRLLTILYYCLRKTSDWFSKIYRYFTFNTTQHLWNILLIVGNSPLIRITSPCFSKVKTECKILLHL